MRIVDNSRRRETYQPPLFEPPKRRNDQDEVNARGIAVVRAAYDAARESDGR